MHLATIIATRNFGKVSHIEQASPEIKQGLSAGKIAAVDKVGTLVTTGISS